MEEIKIALLRHGRTPGNLRGTYVGSTDQPVAPEGIRELQEFAAAGMYPEVEAVFASPMLRCIQTAAVMYPGREPQIVEDLRERHFGDYEDMRHDEIIALPGNEGWGLDEQSMRFPGGEVHEDFLQRCKDAFLEVVRSSRAAGLRSVAVVCHGGVIMALLSQLAQPRRGYFSFVTPNGGGWLLRGAGDTFKITGQLPR